MKIRLNNVRLAFPQLFEAKTVNGEGDPAFGATVLFAPDHAAHKTVADAVEAVGKDKWKDKWPKIKAELASKDRTCLHDGNLKSDYDGFAGMLFVSGRNKVRPSVFDADRSPLAAQDGRPYAGCYVTAVFEVWAQDNNYGKRINATLSGVQFFKDGDAFAGGRAASQDDFEDLSQGTDAESLV